MKEHVCHVAGREWSLDVDYGSATAETGAAYLAMLGIDSVLGLVTSIEKLTDTAVEGTPASPDKQKGLPERLPVEREHCVALVEICWRTILDTLSQLLSRTSGEALIVQLLKVSLSLAATAGSICTFQSLGFCWHTSGSEVALTSLLIAPVLHCELNGYFSCFLGQDGSHRRHHALLQGFQSMTQACGMLEMSDSRDAYLTSLCGHTLTDAASSDHSHASRAEGVTSPTGMLHATPFNG